MIAFNGAIIGKVLEKWIWMLNKRDHGSSRCYFE
jgi:hypothetical protein